MSDTEEFEERFNDLLHDVLNMSLAIVESSDRLQEVLYRIEQIAEHMKGGEDNHG